ncbi:MAG: helix-turn-helix domain-containing protein [bacterium]
MSQLSYSISREAAASYLGVSTRTIDRYVKNGKLSYKKVANKVILAKEQVDALKDEFAMLHTEAYQSEVVSGDSMGEPSSSTSVQPMSSHQAQNANLRQLDQKMDKFFDLLREKDGTLEDKNKMIFVLQQKLGELEGRLKHMVALPAYHEEKAQLLHEKEKLEQKVKDLYRGYTSEKRKNTAYIIIMLVLIGAAIALVFFKK